MSFASLVCFALAAAIAVWVGMVWRGVSQDWLPEDLKAGRLVNVEDILCAVAREKRIVIRTMDTESRTYYTLTQLESLLPAAVRARDALRGVVVADA